MKILIFGLPRQGKTVLAEKLALKLKAVHFNADFIRQNINKDLGFSYVDRVEQAKRMGILCDLVSEAGHHSISDFVCPTLETRKIFNADFSIYVNTDQYHTYIDTQVMFQEPLKEEYDLKIDHWGYDIDKICNLIKNKKC